MIDPAGREFDDIEPGARVIRVYRDGSYVVVTKAAVRKHVIFVRETTGQGVIAELIAEMRARANMQPCYKMSLRAQLRDWADRLAALPERETPQAPAANVRPHDHHCALCDLAEFQGITYAAAHPPSCDRCGREEPVARLTHSGKVLCVECFRQWLKAERETPTKSAQGPNAPPFRTDRLR